MSVDKPKQWDLKRTSRAHKSLSHGVPMVRQSLRLGCLDDWRQLQSNTIQMGVVVESFPWCDVECSEHWCVRLAGHLHVR